MNFLKLLLLFLGTISLMLGVIGIVTPGLPTTPFLLLTAGLYMRSSQSFYNWLIGNKYLGHYIINYQKNKGLTKKSKAKAIIIQWIMITVSCIWGIESNNIRLIVIIAGLIGTYILLFVVPTITTSKDKLS